MPQNIRSQLFRGLAWNFFEKILMRSASFIIGIILARLLSPSDFGLIGMLSIFVAVSNIFIEGGLAKALIQRLHCNDIDYSTAFVSNVGTSLVIYLVLYVSAPFIADFYDEPILSDLTRVLAINFVLGSFNIVQRAKLMANVDFKSLAKINVVSTIVSGVIGISMAYSGMGVWSLVGQTLCSTIVMIVLFPIYSKWKPSIRFSYESFKSLFGYGSKLMITGTVAVIVNNISTIFIGRYYKSHQLGFFTRSLQFADFVSVIVGDVMGTVTFPVLSSVQEEKQKLILIYKKSLFYTSLLVVPVMILLALLARPLVIVLLTEKWLPCVVLLQWLFIARIAYPLSSIHLNILNATGRSDLFMKVDLSKLPMNLFMLAITIPIGIEAIVIGMLLCSYIAIFINAYYPGKMLGYTVWDQLKDWRYIFLSSFIMAICVWLLMFMIKNVWYQLIVCGVVGSLIYLICCLAFKQIDEELLVMLKLKKRNDASSNY